MSLSESGKFRCEIVAERGLVLGNSNGEGGQEIGMFAERDDVVFGNDFHGRSVPRMSIAANRPERWPIGLWPGIPPATSRIPAAEPETPARRSFRVGTHTFTLTIDFSAKQPQKSIAMDCYWDGSAAPGTDRPPDAHITQRSQVGFARFAICEHTPQLLVRPAPSTWPAPVPRRPSGPPVAPAAVRACRSRSSSRRRADTAGLAAR